MQHTRRLSYALFALATSLALTGVMSIIVGITTGSSAMPPPQPTMVGTLVVANPTVVYLVTPTPHVATKPTAHPTLPITHTQPTPTAKPTPTPIPGPPKVPPNPWGYNFTCCVTIFNPPSNFCSYFPCIPNFWSRQDGPGYDYVILCSGGLYSRWGGIKYPCPGPHGDGYVAQLYAPRYPPSPTPGPLPSPTPTATPPGQ
jgi:hypothetical protein